MFSERFFLRHIDFQLLLEHFLIAAVCSLLGLRLYLSLTNYPQIGSHTLHISHMLWGGLLMFIALSLLLIFLNNATKRVAAIIGGLGFGIFIDELGKFLTRDNDYFYQPAIAIIYIVFILIYITLRTLSKYKLFTQKEYLVNSLELIKEAVSEDLDTEEKARATAYLHKADPDDPITKSLFNLYKQLDTIPKKPPSQFTIWWQSLKAFYFGLVKKKWFGWTINVFFVSKLVGSILNTFLFATTFSVIFFHFKFRINPRYLFFSEFAYLTSLALSGAFVIAGVLKMRSNRLKAYQLYKRSLLISILLTYVFLFYQNQLHAFFGLLFNVLVLITLNYMIDQEKSGKMV